MRLRSCFPAYTEKDAGATFCVGASTVRYSPSSEGHIVSLTCSLAAELLRETLRSGQPRYVLPKGRLYNGFQGGERKSVAALPLVQLGRSSSQWLI